MLRYTLFTAAISTGPPQLATRQAGLSVSSPAHLVSSHVACSGKHSVEAAAPLPQQPGSGSSTTQPTARGCASVLRAAAGSRRHQAARHPPGQAHQPWWVLRAALPGRWGVMCGSCLLRPLSPSPYPWLASRCPCHITLLAATPQMTSTSSLHAARAQAARTSTRQGAPALAHGPPRAAVVTSVAPPSSRHPARASLHLPMRNAAAHMPARPRVQVNTKVDMRLRLDAAAWLDDEVREAVRRMVRPLPPPGPPCSAPLGCPASALLTRVRPWPCALGV